MKKNALTKIDNEQGAGVPWLDSFGSEFPLEKLRLLSKTWDQKTWTSYVIYLEAAAKEKLVSHRRFERQINQNQASVFSHSGSGSTFETSKLSSVLCKLTARQRQVIELVFWKGKSHREVARILGVHQSTVAEIKAGAIKKMRSLLEENPVTLPISIEPKQQELKEALNVRISA